MQLSCKGTFIHVVDDQVDDEWIAAGLTRSFSEPSLVLVSNLKRNVVNDYASTVFDRASKLKDEYSNPWPAACKDKLTSSKKESWSDSLAEVDTMDTLPTMGTMDSMPTLDTMPTFEALPAWDEMSCYEEDADEEEKEEDEEAKAVEESPTKFIAIQPKQKGFNSSVQTCGQSTPVSSVRVTTLMLCNLPCKITQEDVVGAADSLGFAGKYDLVYVPRGCNKSTGYGFINFAFPKDASRFMIAFTDFAFPCSSSKKKATCQFAKCQGFAATLESVGRGGNFRRRAHAPLLFRTDQS